jgi:hypothetical protein
MHILEFLAVQILTLSSYASHALEKEPQPLLCEYSISFTFKFFQNKLIAITAIFRANSNEEHIQRLYQDLGCEHHLVQEDSHSAAISISPRKQIPYQKSKTNSFPSSITHSDRLCALDDFIHISLSRGGVEKVGESCDVNAY